MDWEALLSHAFKIGLKPAEFWELSFFEFAQCCAGYNAGMREAAERKAHEMCLHLNIWTDKSKRITPDQLLGRKTVKPETVADIKAYAERAKAEFDASLEGLE